MLASNAKFLARRPLSKSDIAKPGARVPRPRPPMWYPPAPTHGRGAAVVAAATAGDEQPEAAAAAATTTATTASAVGAAATGAPTPPAGGGSADPAAAAPHLILGPPPGSAAPAESECLLVLVPGYGLAPPALAPLAAEALARAPHVRLWAAVAAVDYAALAARFSGPDVSQADLAAAVEASGAMGEVVDGARRAAEARGFKARATGWGRATNMYVLAHSAAGLLLGNVLQRAGAGAVMLASVPNSDYVAHRTTHADDWARPSLVLGGELDGQLRWPWLARHAYLSAALAARAGPVFAAAQRPFVLVPGANHAQTFDGEQPGGSGGRGDIASMLPRADAVAGFGGAIADFVTANAAGVAPGPCGAAVAALRARAAETAALVAPWFALSGMGDVAAPWHDDGSSGGGSSGGSSGSGNANSSGPGPLLQGAFRSASPGALSDALHPGTIATADAFAAAAQRRLLATLPAAAAARVRVVVTVLTDLEAMLVAQPAVTVLPPSPDDGGGGGSGGTVSSGGPTTTVILSVYVLLAWRAASASGHAAALAPAAPEYWLKLKRPQAVAEALGLAGAFGDGTAPRALLEGSISAALAAAPPAVAERYARHGRRLVAGDAERWPGGDAEAFLRRSALRFEAAESHGGERRGEDGGGGSSDGGDGGGAAAVRAIAPFFTTPTAGELAAMAASDSGGGGGGGGSGGCGNGAAARMAAAAEADPAYMARFLGNWYAKAMSDAMAYEWVALDALRPGGGPAW